MSTLEITLSADIPLNQQEELGGLVQGELPSILRLLNSDCGEVDDIGVHCNGAVRIVAKRKGRTLQSWQKRGLIAVLAATAPIFTEAIARKKLPVEVTVEETVE